MDAEVDKEPVETAEDASPFFFALDDLPGITAEEMLASLPAEEREFRFGLFGRDLVTKTILRSQRLCVFHETAPPGARVKTHRHGTYQLTFVLAGELVYGSHRISKGMGYFTPDTLYSWSVGPDGAEWLEIHSGEPALFTDRPDRGARPGLDASKVSGT